MPSFNIDPDFIERLAELLQRTGLNEIEICQGDARVRVAKQATVAVEHVVPPPVPVTAVGTSVATPAALAAASPSSSWDAAARLSPAGISCSRTT